MSKHRRESVEHILDDIESGDAIASVWTSWDVLEQAKQFHEVMDFTQDEAREVLTRMVRYEDANLGWCWNEIDTYIEEIIQERINAE